jgi:hypothetical protein
MRFSKLASLYKMMHYVSMRTTINLDQEVYEIATLYARGRGLTLSKAMNEMVRKATSPEQEGSLSPRLMWAPNGLLIARPTGRVITNEMVKAALKEDEY